MGRREDAVLENDTRIVRLSLTKEQMKLLIDYAVRNGFERKNATHSWDVQAQNAAVKWAVMSRLGFD
jgi:hypothetical protein